ncbi:MAG: hypothetical protein IT427_03650 [Pirellulales bacterium]|nr:hypothetical protein [Pirellulales bacterium]
MWKQRTIGGVAAAAVILILVWWFGWLGEDPALAEVEALQVKLTDPNLAEAESRALMDQLRSKMATLTDDTRRAAWQSGRAMFEQREMSRIDRLLTLQGQEQTKALDDEINRMERRRAEWQQRAAQGQAGGQRGDQTRGQGGLRSRGSQSDEQRIARLRNRLDHSMPEQRAKRAEFVRLINQRRIQRGLPPMRIGRG